MVFPCDGCGSPIYPLGDLATCQRCGVQYEAVHGQGDTVILTRRQALGLAIIPAAITGVLGSIAYVGFPPTGRKNVGKFIGVLALAFAVGGLAGAFLPE